MPLVYGTKEGMAPVYEIQITVGVLMSERWRLIYKINEAKLNQWYSITMYKLIVEERRRYEQN